MGDKFLSFILHALSLHLHHGLYMCMCVLYLFVVVQLLSCVWLSVTPWTAARQASLSFTISWSLLKLMSIESMMPSNHLILCGPLLLLLPIFPASGSFQMSQLLASGDPSVGASACSGLISFRIDWFDLLEVQGTLKSLLQHPKHQFFSAQNSIWSNFYIHTWLLEKS